MNWGKEREKKKATPSSHMKSGEQCSFELAYFFAHPACLSVRNQHAITQNNETLNHFFNQNQISLISQGRQELLNTSDNCANALCFTVRKARYFQLDCTQKLKRRSEFKNELIWRASLPLSWNMSIYLKHMRFFERVWTDFFAKIQKTIVRILIFIQPLEVICIEINFI